MFTSLILAVFLFILLFFLFLANAIGWLGLDKQDARLLTAVLLVSVIPIILIICAPYSSLN